MRSVDTNVLVRLMTRDEEDQYRAAAAYVIGGVWVSHLVLVETGWVLKSVYSRSPRQIAQAFDHLLDHEHVVIQDAEVVRAALEAFRRRPDVAFSDCLMLEAARKSGHLPMGTFDRDLASLDGAERIE
jgi:predicted nucleic-acid-binding protein